MVWREQVAREKRAAYADEEYWGRPVPGFGDAAARILILGLAPAAHGGNRTGRVFTGDRSGDWVFRALFRAGLANQPTSRSADDGLALTGAYIAAAVRCAPPANRPTPDERDRCRPYLQRELTLLSNLRVVVCLGSFAYEVAAREFAIRPRPRFGHGIEVVTPAGLIVICSFHPSQQNTFTGKLTETMFDAVCRRAAPSRRRGECSGGFGGPQAGHATPKPIGGEAMPQSAWSPERERQYEHIKDGLLDRGESEDTAEEIAARTVNKERARNGEAATSSPVSTDDISSGRRGGLRSHSGPGGRTYRQLYAEAQRRNLEGRSKMSKAQLERALER